MSVGVYQYIRAQGAHLISRGTFDFKGHTNGCAVHGEAASGLIVAAT